MFKSILFAVALTSGVGMPCAFFDEVQPIQENFEFKQENKKLVSYDDEDYTITLSADEVQNYTWLNLCNYLSANDYEDNFINAVNFTTSLDNLNFTGYLDDDIRLHGVIADVLSDVAFVIDSSKWNSYISSGLTFNNFVICNYRTGTYLNSNVYMKVSDYAPTGYTRLDLYNDLKHAIELDIEANNQPFMQPVLQELVSLLVSGITAFAGGIGSGVSTLLSDIFINNGHLSVFGSVIAIFGGIALAIGLSRWVMNYLTSLGAKK